MWAEKSLWEQTNYLPADYLAAASHALAGSLERAQDAVARVGKIDPALRLSNLGEWYPLRRSDDLARLVDGLRKAGLPE